MNKTYDIYIRFRIIISKITPSFIYLYRNYRLSKAIEKRMKK